ncbi:putative toxin subunit [Trichoderma chlorosporum]
MSLHELDDKELRVAKDLVQGLFEGNKSVFTAIDSTRSLSRAIDVVGIEAGNSPESKKRLDLLARLDKLTAGNLNLISLFSERTQILSIQDAASFYHLLLNCNEAGAEAFKTRLFATEPTASISSLISYGYIDVIPVAIKPAVIELLGVAIAHGFNIGQDSVENLFTTDAFADIANGSHTEALKAYFRDLQRLQALVRLPEDLHALLQSPFKSAYQIAHTSKDAFVTLVSHYGLPAERAAFVHEHASLVDMRNEQAWAALLASKTEISLSALNSSVPAGPAVAPSTPTSKQATSYTQIFGDVVLGACDDCNSVTSPAAYFVDLLRMLKNTPSDLSNPTGPSLLATLTRRRPDLLTLQLSCVNTNVLIPYIDLANEAMESFIKNVGNIVPPAPVPIEGFNMTDEDTSDNSLSEPQHTDYSIYQTQIASQNFPLTIFPYSQALDMQRQFFSSLKVSLSEVVALFGSELRLLHTSNERITTTPNTLKIAKDVLSSADAAEFLGLSPADHIAITGSSIYSLEFFKAVIDPNMKDKAYGQKIGRLGTAEYWGYEAGGGKTADQLMLSEDNNEGLPYVKSQFLRRADITAEQLLELLGARTLQGQLVLENADCSPIFSGKLEDLRLRHPTPQEANAALTEPDCKLLQSFIRLWHKTGWALQDLDCLIMSFGNRDVLYNIAPQTIVAMAAVQRISDLTGVEIFRLMPLWDLMDTNGDNSLYARLFLGGKAGRQDAVFGRDDQGRYLAGGLSLEEHRAPLQIAFHLTEEGFSALIATANIQNDKLDMVNVTSIYRLSLFCQILAIDPKIFEGLQDLLSPSLVFESPKAAFDIINEFQQLMNAGVSQEQLLFYVGKDQAMPSRGSDLSLSMLQTILVASDIMINVQTSKNDLPRITGDMLASPADVTSASVKLFDSATAQLVAAFIEMVPGTDLTETSSVYENILLPYFSGNDKEAHKVFFEQPEPVGTDEEKAIALEAILNTRRVFFLQSVIGPIQTQIERGVILQVLAPLHPELEPTLLKVLLENLYGDSLDGLPQRQLIIDILSRLSAANELYLKANSSDVFFKPPSADLYRFFVPDKTLSSKPSVTLDGTTLKFDEENGGWASNRVRLSNSQAYSLRRIDGGGLAECSYSTLRSPSQPFPLGTMLAHKTVVFAHSMMNLVSRAAGLSANMKLSVDEVQFFQTQTKPSLAVDFGKIGFGTIRILQKYRALSDKTNGQTTLLQFLKWTNTPPHDGLVTPLAKLTALSETQIAEYLSQRFPGQNDQQLIKLFSGLTELKTLLESVAFATRTGIPGLTLKLLFTLATPIIPPTGPSDFEKAAKLRLLLQSIPSSSNGADLRAQVNGGLRQSQRVALVNYLLQLKYIVEEGITDPDGLFEFLLIDVQMGPCLQTSRIKQAISTVQLYVRRCILGLEKGKDVSSGTINMDRWKWMQNYRLWEANRKVFLYPENWLDASLRDDKTEVFRTLESNILQNDLDSSKVVEFIKSYVYGVGEIADLDVQAYLWKKGEEEWTGTLHFFARTRTAPYIYYYRCLEIEPTPSGMNVRMFWQPWSKIDVEVPVLEVDADGKSLPVSGSYLIPALYGERLFLFFPHITLKTTSNPNVTDKPINTMGQEKPDSLMASKYWQIQIGWTEYRNGKWTPKQVSQATLEAKGAQETDFPMEVNGKPPSGAWSKAQELPGISSFKFWINSRPASSATSKASANTSTDLSTPRKGPEPSTSILVIDVERWIDRGKADREGSQYVNYPLGRFEMRGSQVVLVNLSTIPDDPFKKPWRPTIPTEFGKMSWHIETKTSKPTPGLKIGRGSKELEPLLGIVTVLADSTPKKDVRWTMSFIDSQVRNKNATGLMQDIITTESTISYITYPPIDTLFPSDVFQHTLDRDLISMSTSYEGVDQLYAFLSSVPTDEIYLAFGKRNGAVHELSTPYALYNWELGAHTVMLLMERLQATGQYDLAISMAHFVFDPTIDGTSLDRCWLFPPFKELANGRIDSVEDILKRLKPSSGSENRMTTSILEWRKNPFNPHIVARRRPLAFMRRIIMKYIEILIASGDVYFRQNTLEALPLAIQRYAEASHVFGSAPIQVPRLTKPVSKSYADLEKDFNDFSNAACDMEIDFPFYSDPASRGKTTAASGSVALMGILRTTYFCVPSNPKLVELRNLIDDRLFKIRKCQDINGVVRSLALFEPPIDPGLLVRAAAQGIDVSQLLSNTVGPMPNYRFQYLLQKALELCSELKSMGYTLLSIKEKKDTEALANLRARQDIVIQSFMIEAKIMAKKETESSIDTLLETRKGQVTRLEYYLALSGSDNVSVPDENKDWEDIAQSIEKPTTDSLRMTSHEKLEMQKADEAAALNQKATILDIAAGIIKIIPDIDEAAEPLGVGVSIGSITKNVCEAMLITSSVMRFQAQSFEYEGTRASRTGFLIKQLQERRLQANIAGREIKQTDKQISTARIRVEMCDRDIELQKQQTQQARDTEEWLRSKYTNEELYGWMEGAVRTLYYQTYLIAEDLAQKAQKAFRFEKGDQSVDFIGPYNWDEGRQGMFSGENLYLSLKRLERAYMEQRLHDFELVKNISLRQIRPWALLTLRETGAAEFDLPEVLFDFDFPGHYSRRIKSVGMSIPCIVGPYTGVNATLTLLEHRYRTKPDAKNGTDYPQKDSDERFQTDQIPIQSIAVSHGQQDSGVFNLDFRDERYIPFEGAGVISKWRLELPTSVKQFDYNTISDTVLHVKYTAIQGGAAFRKAASDAASAFQKTAAGLSASEGMFALLDLKNDFPTEWHQSVTFFHTRSPGQSRDYLGACVV